MLDLSIKKQIDPLLKKLASKKSLDVAEELISVILNLIGVKCEKRQLLNIPRIDAELPRFELAPGFARQAAAFKIPIDKINIFDAFLEIKKKINQNRAKNKDMKPIYEEARRIIDPILRQFVIRNTRQSIEKELEGKPLEIG